MGASPLPVADPNDTQAWCRAFFAQLVACGVAVSYTHLTLPTICSV